MNPNVFKRNELLAQKVIKGLSSRNMTGYYAASKEEAKAIALSLLPEGCSVTHGGCTSLVEIGLEEELKSGRYNYCDRSAPGNARAAEMFAYSADAYIGSANAMTDDGIMVNIDGFANRVSAYAYGPKKVILIVGMNKITKDVDDAMKRARNEAATANSMRFDNNTPCTKTGTCMDCKTPNNICCQFLITRYSFLPDRIHVILVNDNLGF